MKERLNEQNILIAPGVYDALTAVIATDCGAEALYLSGASIAYTKIGQPDIGLVSVTEVCETLSNICDRVATPLLVDADTGFGNALNTARTVRAFERAGASAIQLEDQTMPKRCGHLKGKTLVSSAEMTGKLKAALDARQSSNTLIVARTDAIAVEGFNAALDRAESYYEAGADVLFIEAPESAEDMATLCQRFAGKAPLLANMVEGGNTPLLPASELQQLGYGMVIFPGGLVRWLLPQMQRYFTTVLEQGSTGSLSGEMLDFAQLNKMLGTDAMIALGERYADGNADGNNNK